MMQFANINIWFGGKQIGKQERTCEQGEKNRPVPAIQTQTLSVRSICRKYNQVIMTHPRLSSSLPKLFLLKCGIFKINKG